MISQNLTTKRKLRVIYHTQISSNQKLTRNEYAGDFAIAMVKKLRQDRRAWRKKER